MIKILYPYSIGSNSKITVTDVEPVPLSYTSNTKSLCTPDNKCG